MDKESRYALTEYTQSSEALCSHRELKPGLDASICSRCKLAYRTPRTFPRSLEARLDPDGLPLLVKTAQPRAAVVVSKPVLRPQSIPSSFEFQYAVTLHRPWAHAIAHLGKDIENRGWELWLKPGTWLAIHAGQKWDKAVVDSLRLDYPDMPGKDEQPTGVVAIAQFRGNVQESDSEWFFGPVGWQLGNVLALPSAVPCSGKQGVWKPEQGVKNAVYEGLRVPS